MTFFGLIHSLKKKQPIYKSGCCDAIIIDEECSKCGKKPTGAYQSNYKI